MALSIPINLFIKTGLTIQLQSLVLSYSFVPLCLPIFTRDEKVVSFALYDDRKPHMFALRTYFFFLAAFSFANPNHP